MQTISAESLKQEIEAGNTPVLLDVREDWEFDICHIPNSINISMSNVDRMLTELDPQAKTVVICHHGMRSMQVANYLEQNQFSQIINLEGGVNSWAINVDNSMAQY